MTNWDARKLSADVLAYAAFDAIAGYAVFEATRGAAGASARPRGAADGGGATLRNKGNRRRQRQERS